MVKDRVDLIGKANRIASLWQRISKEKPEYNLWAKARILSEKIGCQMKRLPESAWKDGDLHVLGLTNGKHLHVRGFQSQLQEAFVFFHEVGHVLLHFGVNINRKITTKEKEYEADQFAQIVCEQIWPQHKEPIRLIKESHNVEESYND